MSLIGHPNDPYYSFYSNFILSNKQNIFDKNIGKCIKKKYEKNGRRVGV